MEKDKEIWIGIELPTSLGTTKVCIGLNREGGHEVSFCNNMDIELHKKDPKNCPSPWINEGNIIVKEGENAIVFDEHHNLIE
ncbi:MAG: hypothetical protein ACXAAH_16310 [Promethearchaeota archaeon]|jgi:hypothetical protein